MSFNLGFIGGGNMSTAIMQGILKNGVHPAGNIWVSGPHIENLKQWIDKGTNTTTKNGEIVQNCDVIFLGVKPGLLHEIVCDCLKTAKKSLPPKNTLFVSMLAGIKIADLQKELSVLGDDIQVIRIMPNTPSTIGFGACLYTPDSNVIPAQCDILEQLMKACGICERVPEPLMESLGSLVGCGPAYIYILIEALADGAVKQGAPRALAQRMAAQVVAGSGKMVLESGKHPALLKDEVCSPGGSTIAGISVLEDGGIRSSFIKAIEASTQRTRELGQKH